MKTTLWQVFKLSPVLTISSFTLKLIDLAIKYISKEIHIKLIVSIITVITALLLSFPIFISALLGGVYTFIGVIVSLYVNYEFINIPFEDVPKTLEIYNYLIKRVFKNLFNNRKIITFKIKDGEIIRRQIVKLSCYENSSDFYTNQRMKKWLKL